MYVVYNDDDQSFQHGTQEVVTPDTGWLASMLHECSHGTIHQPRQTLGLDRREREKKTSGSWCSSIGSASGILSWFYHHFTLLQLCIYGVLGSVYPKKVAPHPNRSRHMPLRKSLHRWAEPASFLDWSGHFVIKRSNKHLIDHSCCLWRFCVAICSTWTKHGTTPVSSGVDTLLMISPKREGSDQAGFLFICTLFCTSCS